MNNGYTANDIGTRFGKTTNTITALVSKAKKIFELCRNFSSGSVKLTPRFCILTIVKTLIFEFFINVKMKM